MTTSELVAAIAALVTSGAVGTALIGIVRKVSRAFTSSADGSPSAWCIDIHRRDDPEEVRKTQAAETQLALSQAELAAARADLAVEQRAGTQFRAMCEAARSDLDVSRKLNEASQAEVIRLRQVLTRRGISDDD